ncbi:MAG: GHKL domain-containing protein [Clostridiales bacterium]|nr:GHKL domain-containing protein [Clostridiales bacterium]
MNGIIYNISEAILTGTVFSFTMQLMVGRKARLEPRRFLVYLLFTILGYLFLERVPMLAVRIVFWALIVTLLVILFYRMEITKNILYLSAFILLNVVGVITQELLNAHYIPLLKNSRMEWLVGFFGILILAALCAVFLLTWNFLSRNSLRKLYRVLYKRLANTSPSLYVHLTLVLMVVMSVIGLLWIYRGILDKDRFSLYIPFLLLPVLNLIGYLLYKLAIRNKIQLEEQKEKYEQLLIYTGIIEKLTKDIRAFRHDYNNILLTLRSYIEQNDIEGLRTYYYREILKNQSAILDKNSVFLYIEYIKCVSLKGLLTTAFQRALDRDIKISVSIDDYLDETGMQAIDLCRVMGIFLDNAIEAAKDSEDKVLSLSATRDDNQNISIVVANSFSDRPMMNLLFQEGYSTKGEGRGTGLFTLQNILKDYEHVTLNTVIDNGFFVQELNISSACRE